jgi:hypothetical protein
MIHLDTFKIFENKLYIETDDNFGDDIDWKDTIDVSEIWSQYQKGSLDLNSYNKELSIILENKSNDFSEVCEKLKQNLDKETSLSTWDKMYDIADKNLILIKTS